MKYLWGIDLGGTKTEGVVITNSDKPKVVCRLRVPTQAQKGYNHIINNIKNVIDSMQRQTGFAPAGIGIGTPGTTDPDTGLLKNSNTVCLNGMPLEKDIRQSLGLHIVIENDANCFALAETKFGTVARHHPEAQTVFGIILGTGVGSGIVINGHTIKGMHGIGGEWGHNVLVPDGPLCYCGKKGCVETIISGPAIECFFEHTYKHKMSLKQIATLATSDTNCKQTIEYLTDNFAKALANVINILDPEVIVIGGGLGNIKELYSNKTRKKIEQHLFNNCLKTPILKPELGDSAGVFGAAALSAEKQQ